MRYTFTMVVMDRGEPAGWRERLRAKLAADGIELVGPEDAAELHVRGRNVGWARLEELAGADLPGPLAEWVAGGERRWAGRPVGLLRWTHPMAMNDDEVPLLKRSIARAARGAVWNADDAELLETLCPRHFPLAQLMNNSGLQCGEALLETEPGEYLDEVVETARAMFRARGLVALVELANEHDDAGNPIRLREGTTRDDEILSDHDLGVELYSMPDLEFLGLSPEISNFDSWFFRD